MLMLNYMLRMTRGDMADNGGAQYEECIVSNTRRVLYLAIILAFVV